MSDLLAPLRPVLREHASPAPAAEVRRRGERIRRRRVAATSLAAACAVAAIAVTGVAATGRLPGAPAPVAPAGPVTRGVEPQPSESVTAELPADRVIASIPDGFPLDDEIVLEAGSEQEGPSPDVSVVAALRLCGDAAYSPADTATDHLAVRTSGAARAEGRDLSLYADEAAARAAATDIVDKYAACPDHTSEDGSARTVTDVAPSMLGEESWVVSRSNEAIGTPESVEQVHVVRLGTAVLVTQVIGLGGLDEDGFAQWDAEQSAALRPVLEALVQ